MRRYRGVMWHDILTYFHDDRFRHASGIKLISSQIWEAALLELLMGIIYVERSRGMIYLSRFMQTGADVQAILQVCLRNPNGCDVGIIDWKDT
jgi:hypothetical protein